MATTTTTTTTTTFTTTSSSSSSSFATKTTSTSPDILSVLTSKPLPLPSHRPRHQQQQQHNNNNIRPSSSSAAESPTSSTAPSHPAPAQSITKRPRRFSSVTSASNASVRDGQTHRPHQSPHDRPRTSPGSQALSPLSPRLNNNKHNNPLSPDQPSPASDSYFALRSAASTDLRSPPIRRPPASRSSHGIATSAGPPPALSTQRSYSTDSWRWALAEGKAAAAASTVVRSSAAEQRGASQLTLRALERLDADNGRNAANDPGAEAARGGSFYERTESRISDRVRKRLQERKALIAEVEAGDDYAIADSEDEDGADMAVSGGTGYFNESTRERASLLARARSNSKRLSAHFPTTTEGQSQSSHEDLFLDLAKNEDYTITQEPRSRIALPSHRPSQSHTGIAFEDSDQIGSSPPVLAARRRSLQRPAIESPLSGSTQRASTLRGERAYPASAHPLETSRYRSRLSGAAVPSPQLTPTTRTRQRDPSPELPLPGRRQSVTENFSRPYRNSQLTQVAIAGGAGASFSSPTPARHSHHNTLEVSPTLPQATTVSASNRAEGTESTVSTTAPSTVWDELDDLKSRIRKLELTGALPPSAGAALTKAVNATANATSSERPRTATTTVTTMSSGSPKRTRGHSLSPTEVHSPIPDADAATNPLLASALQKAQTHLSAATYRALEGSVADALAVSRMASTSTVTVDRNLRRKADSLCRSLTELCVSLSDNPPPTSATTARPPSRDRAALLARRNPDLTIDIDRTARAQSLDADPPPASARVLSRLEARRSSLAGGGSGAGSFLSSSRERDSSAGGSDRRVGAFERRGSMDRHYHSSMERSMERSAERANGGFDERDARVSSRASPTRGDQFAGSAAEAATPTQSTLGRANTLLGRLRQRTGADASASGGSEDDVPIDGHQRALRPLSRANTEATAAARAQARNKRMSREYTSQHPLPNPAGGRAEARAEEMTLHRSLYLPADARTGSDPQWSPALTQRERERERADATITRRSYLGSTVASRRRVEEMAQQQATQQQLDEEEARAPGTPSTTIGPSDRRRYYFDKTPIPVSAAAASGVSNGGAVAVAEEREARSAKLGAARLSGRFGTFRGTAEGR